MELLAGLDEHEWALPTVCDGWDVKDVALHLLGGELANLSRRRDGAVSAPPEGQDLGRWLNARNDEWVQTARFLGNPTLIDLLDFTGAALEDYLASLDLDDVSAHVSWVGDDPVPVWLDVARELTERWVHQQQVRDATGRRGLNDPELMRTVLSTFVHALPKAYRDVAESDGTAVELRVTGRGGGVWHLTRGSDGWRLAAGPHPAPRTRVTHDEDSAWRLFTRNPLGRGPRVEGDEALADVMRSVVAIVT